MLIKFRANYMKQYEGTDGNGGLVSMQAGDIADVSENVAKILLQKHHHDFEVVMTERAKHAPTADKLTRKQSKFQGK
jgi:hypothetical protein